MDLYDALDRVIPPAPPTGRDPLGAGRRALRRRRAATGIAAAAAVAALAVGVATVSHGGPAATTAVPADGGSVTPSASASPSASVMTVAEMEAELAKRTTSASPSGSVMTVAEMEAELTKLTAFALPPGGTFSWSFPTDGGDLSGTIDGSSGLTVTHDGSIVATVTAPGGPGTMAYDVKGPHIELWFYRFADGRGAVASPVPGMTFTAWTAQTTESKDPAQ